MTFPAARADHSGMSQNSPPEPSERIEGSFQENGAAAPLGVSPSARQRPREQCAAIAPRLLRLRDAPRYLGMDKNRFNREVRPRVTVIPIGIQGVAFDRLDLDAWADEHKRRNGCPAAQSERTKPWETTERQASPSVVGSGTSTKCSEELAFARALRRTISPKPRSNSPGG